MRNLFYYLATVFIWGTTWMAIKMQLGTVDPMVSVSYRFILAALILLVWCRARRLPMRFPARQHLFIALQGSLLFALNYLLFYVTEQHIASGLAAVVFSTILLMNMVNGTLFLGSPMDNRVIAGAACGLTGMFLVFRPEITSFSLANDGLRGLLLCLAATYLASLGNILSARNQRSGLPVVQTNAYGMAYGALLMVVLSLVANRHFQFDPSLEYMGSLAYLALFGSVIAFGCYLSLIGSIGADRAAYATLLFPLIALAISTIWENFHWRPAALCGVALILAGNLIMLRRKPRAATPNPATTSGETATTTTPTITPGGALTAAETATTTGGKP